MIDRNKCKLDNLIAMPFGYQYEIKDQQLFIKNDSVEDSNAVEIKSDNRNLCDASSNQKLTREEIEGLKKDMQNSDITGAVSLRFAFLNLFLSSFNKFKGIS